MTAATLTLSANMEDYLETIFILIREKTVARSRDIARLLSVNRSSVTGALQALSRNGLVNYEPYGYVTLTREGAEVAEKILRRHEALRDFFVRVLAIDSDEADEAACRMEHGISKHIVDRLIDFAEFVEVCPRAGAKWVHGFGYQCREASISKDTCERCITRCLDEFKQGVRQDQPGKPDVPLKELKPGEKGQISRIAGAGGVKQRIRDMGVTKGSLVEVVRIAPMGDPMDVKLKGYHLSLRKDEAEDILVKKVDTRE
ncbi:MAG: DtxR family transcriptional regulator [Spartobacteria bacterium]|nr:DtxR family transcriptional regulator [Spartobacteria bacterium]